MPAVHRLDPTLLEAVARAANRSSAAALEASQELLAHYSDIGHAPSQRAVDTLVDRAAEALRGLTDSLADISSQLPTTSVRATSVQAAAVQPTSVMATAVQTTAPQTTAPQTTAPQTTSVMATPASGPSGPGRDHRT